MVIDFPEAEPENPSQCIALAVDAAYINNTVNYLNEFYNSEAFAANMNGSCNSTNIILTMILKSTGLINKLMRVCSSADRTKNIYADLNLKELLIRLVQSQYLQQVTAETNSNTKQHAAALHAALYS